MLSNHDALKPIVKGLSLNNESVLAFFSMIVSCSALKKVLFQSVTLRNFAFSKSKIISLRCELHSVKWKQGWECAKGLGTRRHVVYRSFHFISTNKFYESGSNDNLVRSSMRRKRVARGRRRKAIERLRGRKREIERMEWDGKRKGRARKERRRQKARKWEERAA